MSTTPIEYLTPSKLTDDTRAKLAAWIEDMPPEIAAVARAYPMTTCYRSSEDPKWHYVIQGYDQDKEGGAITVTLVHGSDSTLPGVCTFGQAIEQLIKCDCGKWEGPTVMQTKATHARMMARFVKPGDVVQLDPDKSKHGPVFVVVETVEPTGVTGYFLTHDAEGSYEHALVSVEHDAYTRIGEAAWVADGDEDEETPEPKDP